MGLSSVLRSPVKFIRLITTAFWCAVVSLALCAGARAQTPDEPEETYTLEDYAEEEDYTYNHHFWGVEFGPSFPVGSSKRFYLPRNIVFNQSPEPYSEFFREGYSANVYTGIMTDDGFEASLSFRMTKINYTNQGTAQNLDDVRDIAPNATFSSYLLGTQVFLGQRLKPIYSRRESLYM
ncbi:MAG TPA: hypothetical protein VLB27_08275, partial [candidate division Zixibacteria bacterium]|nr:hypothetical protein [candidate division Zixibacteria bacterium]